MESVNDAAHALDEDDGYIIELANGEKRTINPKKYGDWADVVEFGTEHYPNTVVVSDIDQAVGLVTSERDHIEIIKVTDPITGKVWDIENKAPDKPIQWAKDHVWIYDDQYI